MSDRLALAKAIEDAGIERSKAEQLAATAAGPAVQLDEVAAATNAEEHRHGPHRPRRPPAAPSAAAADARAG